MNTALEITENQQSRIAAVIGSSCFTVYMPLKKKWFDMILSGNKREEYRDITDYWEGRIFKNNSEETSPNVSLFLGGLYTGLDYIIFRNGYRADSPMMVVKCDGVTIGSMNKEWTESGWTGDVFILKLGAIIYRENCL